MANLVEKRSFTPQKFYAGEFPVVRDTGKRVPEKGVDGRQFLDNAHHGSGFINTYSIRHFHSSLPSMT